MHLFTRAPTFCRTSTRNVSLQLSVRSIYSCCLSSEPPSILILCMSSLLLLMNLIKPHSYKLYKFQKAAHRLVFVIIYHGFVQRTLTYRLNRCAIITGAFLWSIIAAGLHLTAQLHPLQSVICKHCRHPQPRLIVAIPFPIEIGSKSFANKTSCPEVLLSYLSLQLAATRPWSSMPCRVWYHMQCSPS